MPTPQERGPRRPRPEMDRKYRMEGDWAVPNQRPAPPPQRRTPTQE